MKTYTGDVKITKENQKEWKDKLKLVEKITGYLYVYSNISLPKLTSIGGDLYVHSNVSLETPKLTSVGGDLSVHSNISLPKLTSVGGYLSVYSNISLLKLTSIGGDLSVYSNVSLPKFTSIGGDLYVYSQISHELEKRLWEKNKKNKWTICDLQSDWLIERVSKKADSEFTINNVSLPLKLFSKIRSGSLSAKEVFAIQNTEQRRVAYEKMDKKKMKELENYKVLDEVKDDGCGNPMKIVSFEMKGYDSPFYFLNCFCASTKREYFVETRETECWAAKSASFGLSKGTEFEKEW